MYGQDITEPPLYKLKSFVMDIIKPFFKIFNNGLKKPSKSKYIFSLEERKISHCLFLESVLHYSLIILNFILVFFTHHTEREINKCHMNYNVSTHDFSVQSTKCNLFPLSRVLCKIFPVGSNYSSYTMKKLKDEKNWSICCNLEFTLSCNLILFQ